MRNLFKNFKSESGATLVEYGVALILAIVVGGTALISLAGETGENMTETCGVMSDASTLIAANCTP